MAKTKHSFFQKFCASAGMAALLFTMAQSSAMAQEVMPDSDTSAPAMQRIHSFTHKATELAMTAMTLIGSHYKYGGNSPETGIDCSGLVRYVFKEAWGATVPRTSLELSRAGEEYPRPISSPVIWFFTIPDVAVIPMSVFIWATTSSSTHLLQARKSVSTIWRWLTGNPVSMGHAASPIRKTGRESSLKRNRFFRPSVTKPSNQASFSLFYFPAAISLAIASATSMPSTAEDRMPPA